MSSYKELYRNLCRICLSYNKTEDMVSLIKKFSKDGLSDFGRTVLCFVNISIETNNKLPNSMCKQCLALLKQAVYFKLRCESSDKKLKQCREIYEQNKFSGINIEEIVVDNLIFSKYFPEETLKKLPETSRESSFLKKNKNKCSLDEVTERCESVTSSQGNNDDIQLESDVENSDEILNLMERSIGICPEENNSDYQTYLHKKLILKRRRQAKLRQQKQALKLKILRKEILPRKYLSEKNFLCKTCNKTFTKPSLLRYHMQKHTGYHYICEHCGKGFTLPTHLNMHQIMQHGKESYIQCKLCDFKAARQYDLDEHIRIHTGERPFTCEKCGLTFRRRAIWKKHLILHSEKTIQCPQCPKKFYKESDLYEHRNSMHERLYLYACHECNATYAKNTSVRKHLTEKHGIPREEQGKIVRINKRS